MWSLSDTPRGWNAWRLGRRQIVAAALIALGGALALGAPSLIRMNDLVVARLRGREVASWVRRNDVPAAGATRSARPGTTVIVPGKDGYLLIVPRLGLRLVVRELEPAVFSGRNTPALRRYGLGQVPYTRELRNVSPGAVGTAAITGHRTTSGAPFRHIDRLRPGDLIIVRKSGVEQRWAVVGAAVVPPSAVEAIKSRPAARRLVLLACTPPFTARERLLVTARLTHETVTSAVARTATRPRQ
jgi:sortase A